jgi:hypothetical protein
MTALHQPGVLRSAAFAALTLGLVAAAALASLPARAEQSAAVARADAVRGHVTLIRGGATRPLAQGAALELKDRVRTGAGARLRIAFNDGATVVLGEATTLEIARYGAPKGGLAGRVLSLVSGIVRAVLPSGAPPGGFEIRTKAAVASVRSTDWIVEHANGKSAVFTVQGYVHVSGQNREVVLPTGFGTDIAPGQPPTEPRPWGAGRAASAIERTRIE